MTYLQVTASRSSDAVFRKFLVIFQHQSVQNEPLPSVRVFWYLATVQCFVRLRVSFWGLQSTVENIHAPGFGALGVGHLVEVGVRVSGVLGFGGILFGSDVSRPASRLGFRV